MISPKLLAAVKSLLNDINAMRARADSGLEAEHYFEGFPEFYVEQSTESSLYGRHFCNIEWPNLSISALAVEAALKAEGIALDVYVKDAPDYAHPRPEPNPNAPPSDAATQTGMYDRGDIPE